MYLKNTVDISNYFTSNNYEYWFASDKTVVLKYNLRMKFEVQTWDSHSVHYICRI